MAAFALILELLKLVVQFGMHLELEFARKSVDKILEETFRREIEVKYSERLSIHSYNQCIYRYHANKLRQDIRHR
jgi:hypothetical protein